MTSQNRTGDNVGGKYKIVKTARTDRGKKGSAKALCAVVMWGQQHHAIIGYYTDQDLKRLRIAGSGEYLAYERYPYS
jgi:hypothetical protein